MICEKCGTILSTLEVLFFDRDGSDFWTYIPINEVPDNAVYIDIDKSWTGDGMSQDEQSESIRCPFCKQHPFKKIEVDTHDFVRVVMFKHTAEVEE